MGSVTQPHAASTGSARLVRFQAVGRTHTEIIMLLMGLARRHAFALALLTWAGNTAVLAAEHTLVPTPQTVHIGHFLAMLKAVLSIESGDIVTLESTASIVPSVVDASGVVPPSAVPQYQRDIYRTVQDRGPGPHVLTGPIEIKGAVPGDVLEVRILDVQLALDWATIGSGPTPAHCRTNSRRCGTGSFRSTAPARPPRWRVAWSSRLIGRFSGSWVLRLTPVASAAARPACMAATWTTRI